MHPNIDITLDEITERFQGGDPTMPLDEFAINALDVRSAIDLIVNNKLPLTDEARGELDSMLKFDVDYRDKDIYDAPDYWSIEGPNKKMNEIKENKNYELINFFNNPYNEIPSSTGTTIIRKV